MLLHNRYSFFVRAFLFSSSPIEFPSPLNSLSFLQHSHDQVRLVSAQVGGGGLWVGLFSGLFFGSIFIWSTV
jgi:hypothetical protein